MITNLPPPTHPTTTPESQTVRNVGICLFSHQEVFQTEVWVWRGDGVMRVCSFRCLFSFWLDCVSLDVSQSAHGLIMAAAIDV